MYPNYLNTTSEYKVPLSPVYAIGPDSDPQLYHVKPNLALSPQELLARFAAKSMPRLSSHQLYFDVPFSSDVPANIYELDETSRSVIETYQDRVSNIKRQIEIFKSREENAEQATNASAAQVDEQI